MTIAIGWFVFSILAGVVAASKGRSGFGVFLLALLLSPLVGLIVAFAMRRQDDLDRDTARRSGQAGGFRKCPSCAEAVRRDATKCRFCGSALEPVEDDRSRFRQALDMLK